jgi:lysophospholipid acyltransferase (LPLAT)-like uncharacterized protein
LYKVDELRSLLHTLVPSTLAGLVLDISCLEPHCSRNFLSLFTKNPKLSFAARITASKAYIFIGGWCIRIILQLLYATLRIECKGVKPISHPCIIALWHNQLALAMLVRRFFPEFDYSVVVSNSRDGKLLGSYVKTHSRFSVIHVGHKSRLSALLQIVNELKTNKILIITPDGPRGPIYEVKGGVAFSALKAEAMILPMRWEASRMWRLGTWDHLQFPRPFSKVTIYFEEPIACTQASDIDTIKVVLKTRLDAQSGLEKP